MSKSQSHSECPERHFSSVNFESPPKNQSCKDVLQKV